MKIRLDCLLLLENHVWFHHLPTCPCERAISQPVYCSFSHSLIPYLCNNSNSCYNLTSYDATIWNSGYQGVQIPWKTWGTGLLPVLSLIQYSPRMRMTSCCSQLHQTVTTATLQTALWTHTLSWHSEYKSGQWTVSSSLSLVSSCLRQAVLCHYTMSSEVHRVWNSNKSCSPLHWRTQLFSKHPI